MYKDIGEIEFAEKCAADSNAMMLDVRTLAEYDAGYIKGCTMIDFFSPDFQQEIQKLDKSKNYYVYCRSGNRSGQACSMMAQMGFNGELYNLGEGILGWTQELE
jgi:rhodanese-related sulfurtransferase